MRLFGEVYSSGQNIVFSVKSLNHLAAYLDNYVGPTFRTELKVFSVKSLYHFTAYLDKYAGPIFRTELKVLSVKV
jgi:hypothetical protein